MMKQKEIMIALRDERKNANKFGTFHVCRPAKAKWTI